MSSFDAPASTDGEPPAREVEAGTTGSRRRALFTGVPLALVGSIAMSLGLATPADATTQPRQFPKAKSHTPGSTAAKTSAAQAVAAPAPASYVVTDGDTVSGIASRFGLSTTAVLSMNGLAGSSLIFPGQVLTLTPGAAPAPPIAPSPSATSHTVVTGDTVSGIAARHGLSSTSVLAANGLDEQDIIRPGQVIALPVNSASGDPAPAASVQHGNEGQGATHTVTEGETVTSIASTAGTSVRAVLEANGLSASSVIYPGQVLAIPVSAPSSIATTPLVSVTPIDSARTVLTDEMRRNAEVIVSVGRSAGVEDYGLVIALATAAQESALRNLDHGDRDSLGLFQQRPSAGWGSPEQVMDPERAARAFFGGAVNPNPGITRGLLDIPGWRSMSVTDAAQAVQLSAYPQHYAKWESAARAWLAELG